MFSAYVVNRDGNDVTTAVTELDDAELSGDVLVSVEYSSVNYKDAMVAQPGTRVARISPIVPGIDLAGRVEESTDPALAIGSAVLVHGYGLGVSQHGGFAERARVPADWVVPLPAGLDPRRAMAVGTAGFTAVLSLRRLQQVGVAPGDGPVLVTGATGGVGSVAVAALAAQGYEVVASTGKDGEHDYLRRLGATEIIGRDELTAETKGALGSERWAAAVDCVGGATLAGVLRSLKYGGAVAASGLTGGTALETTVFPFIIRHVALLGVDSVETAIDVRRQVWDSVPDVLSDAVIDEMVHAEIGLDDLDGALAEVFAGAMRGRVLVRPSA
ncbi:MAG TPA: acryloyl-CoA reductase [Acidimicrobiales bacterium]|nr:acryloyl-CoA reductase [Acidimicrobiales bacterium]